MKTSHIFWGIFFLAIGSLLLLANFTDWEFTWNAAWKFWPLVLVLIGVSILVKNQIGKNIVAGLAGIILAIILYASITTTTNIFHNDIGFVFDDDYDFTYDTTYFKTDYSDSVTSATINFNGGAGSFKMLTPTKEYLGEFRAEGNATQYTLNRNDIDSHSELDFKMKEKKIRLGNKRYENNVEMSLNPNPEWELNFDIGAASMDLDLTPYKVSKVDIEMGAAALNVKLGNLTDITKLIVKAGASDIDILIPDSSGCEINSDVSLSSKNYRGFNKISKNIYQTENFNSSNKKIYIEIDCGVSSIDVRKY